MRITSHGQFLTQLTRLPRIFPVNCYLVQEDDGLTLVDTTIGGSASAILAATARRGQRIRRIALTHAHADHVGSLDALHALLPDAEVLISARDARFLKGDNSLVAAEAGVKLRGGFRRCTTIPTRLIAPGDRVGSLLVADAPGHSPGHLAFLDTRDGTLIAGDAYQTRGGIAVAGIVRPLFPFVAMGTWNAELALTSARSLRALNPARLAVGHGLVLDAPQAAMDRAIGVAEQALARRAPRAA